jgi:hypothetical protein
MKRFESDVNGKIMTLSLSQTSAPVAGVAQHGGSGLYLIIGLVMGAISSALMIAFTKKQARLPA